MLNSFALNAKAVPPGFAERLAVFLDVAASGSFSLVGRRLDLAPSSIARQIAKLEAQVGAQLFRRSTRGLALTHAGELLRDHGLRALHELADAHEAVSLLQGSPRGLLRITAPAAFGQRHLMPILTSFLAAYPEVRVELILDDGYLDLVRQRIDLAVRIGVLDDSRLVSTRIARQQRVLCASPAYIERYGAPQTLDELAQHECLTTAGTPPLGWWTFGSQRNYRHIAVKGRLVCNSTEAILQAARQGAGIAHLAAWLTYDSIRSGHLVRLLEHIPAHQEATIQAVWTRSEPAPKVRALLEHLRQAIGEPAYWDIPQAPASP